MNVSLAALVALAECLGARGAGRGSGRPAGALSRRPGRRRGPPAAARRPPDRLDPGPGAARAVLSGPGLRLAEAAAHRRRRAHHRAHRPRARARRQAGAAAHRPAAGRRPQPARCWLTERARHPAARRGEPALWLGRRGRLSARQLQRIVAELGADARLVDVSAHTLRHTAATRWLRAGVDVVVVVVDSVTLLSGSPPELLDRPARAESPGRR